MPRININDAEQYSSGGNYFSLKDDGDVAQVRLLIDSEEDVEVYAVHQIQTKEGNITVNCLREPGAAIDTCPLCQNRHKPQVSLFIKLIHEDTIKVWNRGKTFYETIKGLIRRYKPLPAYDFEVERHGKAGDSKTTYQFYQVGDIDDSIQNVDDLLNATNLELDNKLEILGNYVRDWSYDEMWDYLESGKLPDNNNQAQGGEQGGRNYNRMVGNQRAKQPIVGRRGQGNEVPQPPRRASQKQQPENEAVAKPRRAPINQPENEADEGY